MCETHSCKYSCSIDSSQRACQRDVSAVLPTYEVSMRPPRCEGSAMRVLSWNVASLRSMLTKVMVHWHWVFG